MWNGVASTFRQIHSRNQALASWPTNLTQELCPQMGMLRELVTADFRDYNSSLSFPLWAEKLPAIPAVQHEAPDIPELPEPTESTESEPSAKSVPCVEDLCSLLDSASDGEMANAITSIEEALQMKDVAGAFLINKQNGRQRLQNKLKRAKARLADILAKCAEATTQPHSEVQESQISQQVKTEDYEEQPGTGESRCGCGPIDNDGYHGVPSLPWWKRKSYYYGDRNKNFFRVFMSYPRSIQCPPEPWCTSIKPTAFCCLAAKSGRWFLKEKTWDLRFYWATLHALSHCGGATGAVRDMLTARCFV